MTALLAAKYGNFNQNILLTNLVYETAMQIRTTQNYGISTKGVDAASTGCSPSSGSSMSFMCAYGIAFSKNTTSSENTRFQIFADGVSGGQTTGDYILTTQVPSAPDVLISTYYLKRGAIISGLVGCDNSACTASTSYNKIFIAFKRPDPEAIITGKISAATSSLTYVKITIQGTDGTTRAITVRKNGQISVDI